MSIATPRSVDSESVEFDLKYNMEPNVRNVWKKYDCITISKLLFRYSLQFRQLITIMQQMLSLEVEWIENLLFWLVVAKEEYPPEIQSKTAAPILEY